MEQYKQEFIEFMVDCDVLKFGEFTLKSGRKSPFFMNAGAYVTGSQLKKLGEYYAKAIHDKYGDDFDYQLAKRIFSEKKEKCRCERLLYAEQIEKEYRKASEKYKYMQFRKYSYVYESFLYDIFSNEKYISKEHFGGIKKQIFCNLVKYLCKNNDKKAEELIQQWHEKELIYTDCEYVFLGETLTVYSNLLSSEDESISTWRKRNNIKMFI